MKNKLREKTGSKETKSSTNKAVGKIANMLLIAT